MAHRRLTLMVVPHSYKRVREITISYRTLWIALASLAVVALMSVSYAIGFHLRSGQEDELFHARHENLQLAGRIRDISSSVVTLKNQMDELVRKEEMLRVMANLPQMDQETLLMGVGGMYVDEAQGDGVLSEASRLGMDVHANIEQLLRQARFHQKSFETIEQSFSGSIEFRDHLPTIWPVSPSQVYISSSFGMRSDPFTGRRRMHAGVDLAGRTGTPVMATANGVVKNVVQGRYIGKVIQIDHLNGYQTLYGHMNRTYVQKGQRITRGQIIGELGNSGRSTGPHLHYGVIYNGRAVDPLDYFYAS